MEAQLEQLVAQVQQLTQANQALQQQVQGLQHQAQQQQQQQQQPQQQPGGQLAGDARARELALRDAKKSLASLGKFDNSGPWRCHEDQFRAWGSMNADVADVGHEFLKLALYMSMKGKAVERVRIFKPDSAEWVAAGTIEQYIALYRGIFQPVEESEASRMEYKAYVQAKNEDIASYLSTKISLWNNAFEMGHRSFSTLLDDSIEGMYNVVIQRIVRRANPENEQQLRNVAIQAVANEFWLYRKGKSEATSLDGLTPVTLHQQSYREDRMEIDGISNVTCYRCGNKGHKKPQCKVRLPDKGKKDDRAGPAKGARWGGSKAKPDDVCNYCQRKGHWSRDCFKKKNDEKRDAAPGKKDTRGGAKSIEQEQESNPFLEEIPDEDSDP